MILTFSWWTRVTTILAPEQPIGCPKATAPKLSFMEILLNSAKPPHALTFSWSKPRSLINVSAVTEKASLISHLAMFSFDSPCFMRRILTALTGAIVKSTGANFGCNTCISYQLNKRNTQSRFSISHYLCNRLHLHSLQRSARSYKNCCSTII